VVILGLFKKMAEDKWVSTAVLSVPAIHCETHKNFCTIEHLEDCQLEWGKSAKGDRRLTLNNGFP
jgi:hypothetical protein